MELHYRVTLKDAKDGWIFNRLTDALCMVIDLGDMVEYKEIDALTQDIYITTATEKAFDKARHFMGFIEDAVAHRDGVQVQRRSIGDNANDIGDWMGADPIHEEGM